ncbi:MAG: SelB C-terminal domain-containing protein [Candidatus Limnocylindria bacterium]
MRALAALHREQPLTDAFRVDTVVAAALAQPADRRPPSHRGGGRAEPQANDLRAAIERLATRGEFDRDGRRVSLPGSRALGPEMRSRADELIRRLRAVAPSVPPTQRVARVLGLPDSVIDHLRRTGEIVAIDRAIDLPSDLIETLRTRLVEMIEVRGGVTAAEYRDAIGAGRRHAIAILEYFDRIGVTRRDGEARILT